MIALAAKYAHGTESLETRVQSDIVKRIVSLQS